MMSGKSADLRAAGKAHEEALDAVLKAAPQIIQQSGGTVTDATKQAIATTLHALRGSHRSARTAVANAAAERVRVAGRPAGR